MKFKDMIRFFKKYFKDEKRLFIKSFFLLLATALVGTLYGYLIGLAIDKASNSSFDVAIAVLFLILILNVIDNLIFDKYGKIYMEKCANNMMEKIGVAVYEKVGMLPARAFEEKSSGEFINRITSDASTISDSFRQVLRIAISDRKSVV